MLTKTRRVIAIIVWISVTLLFLDFTGTIHLWLGWLAKIQLIPAILAINIIVIGILVLLTLLFGRIYCSIICPLGIMQDGISHVSAQRKGKKNRFRYSTPLSWLRYGTLGLFIIGIIASISILVSLLDPYAAYGRIVSNLLNPLYRFGNNLLALFSERIESYIFYSTEVWIKSGLTFGITLLTLIIIGILAWRNGRTWCNTLCPVGTFLGFLSRFSLYRPTFNTEKCTKCGLCEKGCKASCINSKELEIDQSRCVTCFNCIEKCKFGAMEYTSRSVIKEKEAATDKTLRSFLTLTGLFTISQVVKAQQLHVDGGLADIEDKKEPDRKTPLVPPGAESLRNMNTHCTACQLCVSACPNHILRPSGKLSTFMQPEITFERGYCRPECTECSQVCPTKAIRPITKAEKTAISIGQAVWIEENCIVNRDKLTCTSCERHCPTGAITRIPIDPEDQKSLKYPIIDKEMCIGCGACEHHCPARPFSAIYVEGNVRHMII